LSASTLEPDLSARFNEFVFFFNRFLRKPANVASICPSSRYLSRRMMTDLHLQPDDVVLEFGPGTGAFTRVLHARYQGNEAPRYLGIEKDHNMYDYLVRTFDDLQFVRGDVRDVKTICDARDFPPATIVICGVPLTLMDDEGLSGLLSDVSDCMADTAVFRTFSYLHCYPTAAASRLRAHLRASFEGDYDSAPVIRNLPPALVLTGEK
jgi:phospholipid N-methyltransferase